MLSTDNFKQGSTSTTERRVSAPPISRPAVFSPSSLPITQVELPQSRPRSNSQVQIPLYSPTTFARPLPVLPISPANAKGRYGRDVNMVKAPVQEGADVNVDGEVESLQTSLPSPHILNSNRLHPSNHGYGYGYSNSPHPHSPQMIPNDFPYSSQVQQQQGQQPSSTGWSHSMATPDSRSLDYRSSVSSSSSNSHPNANQPPSGLHNEVYRPRRHLDIPGRQSSSEDVNQSLYQKTANDSTGALRTSWVEPSQQQHHHPANHLSQNDPLKQQPSPACLSSFTSCPAESSSVTGLPRLYNLDTSPSSPRSTVEYNSGDMSSLTSSSPIHPEYPVHLPSDLQPYCPPPPPLGNARSVVLPWHQGHSEGNPIPSTFTAQTPASAPLPLPSPLPASAAPSAFIPPPPDMMAGSKTTSLAPNHSTRRHSSGAQELFIKTKHLHSIKPGPSTADVSSSATTSTRTTTSRNRYLDPEVSAKGSSRNTSRIRQSSPSRSSINQLDIPRLQQQIQSPPPQQQQRTHYSHHSKHHQHPVSPQNKVSTLRSPNSSRTASPASSGFLETFQDRTAMALMQRYLMRPDDPDSEADIAMQIMISQAAVDSKGFEILVPQTVERIKRHYATLSSRITALTARLSLESKIREAAQSLLRLHADNKKLARQANDHLEAANRKVDQVATELWKLTQLAADFQRTLLQHTSGVLALGVVRLEDQSRREREIHAMQLQEARIGRDVEEQFESMAKAVISLESDALEAQSLLEDKDRAIERLMKQLEHQRDLFIKLDDQQQKAMALSRSHQANMEKVDENSDAKTVAELRSFLSTVQERLQSIFQKQQEQHRQRTKDTSADGHNAKSGSVGNTESEQGRFNSEKGWSSESTLTNKTAVNELIQDGSMTPACEDSMSSGPSGTTTLSETLVDSKPSTPPGSSSTAIGQMSYFSMDGIRSILDALESHVTESHQKMHVLEGEIGLLRRQSLVLSTSRNNSIKIKNFSAPTSREGSSGGGQAEERIRSALEKSLKDALLAKEMAQQELENERQRWQEDQNHRISALEESLVAAEDKDKTLANRPDLEINGGSSKDEVVQELRRQLQDAIDEIDVLNHQQQSNLQLMRQLFDLLPDTRRKSHLDLLTSHQQLQQQIATSPAGSVIPQGSTSGRVSPSKGASSLVSTGIVGFSMEALIDRVKELVARLEQVERDNGKLRHSTDSSDMQSGQISRTASPSLTQANPSVGEGVSSTKILKSEFERLQANADKVPLLENELDLLKQHADVLMEENARLAELAAASVTSTPVPARSTMLGAVAKEPTRDDSLDELQEIIRLKDRLLRERDQLVQEQEMALRQAKIDLTNALTSPGPGVDTDGSSPAEALSDFDVTVMEDLRHKYGKLEAEAGEMRMVIAALESMSGGPGSGSQLLKSLSISSNSPSPGTSSWLASSLGAVGSLSFGSLVQSHPAKSSPGTITSPRSSAEEASGGGASSSTDSVYSSDSTANLNTDNNRVIVAGATAALRKEFRRAMGDLREEKERAIRKEVEERRRLERELRQMRRELQAVQINDASPKSL
ncbi:MAG: hypothetical protein J3Q66DRAFT_349939 [Benniella sp.]|nr:MAG: hypothetical protein J3Q66DRAFT_349939 [Benniella sp.]